MAALYCLEASMADLERSHADFVRVSLVFERKARAVGSALQQLQRDVAQADAPVTAAREELGAEHSKRRRLSGAAAPPPGQLPDWHVDINEEKRPFNEAVEEAEEKLQGASHAMAQVHVTVQQVRASMETVKAEVAPLLGRLAAAREAQNNSCSALLEMFGRSDADAAVLGELSVAAVWRLRGVSRAFRGWCGSVLATMPRVVAFGGVQGIGHDETPVATVVSLDLATLAWGGGGTVPDLPGPRAGFSLGQLAGGRLVVAGGISKVMDNGSSVHTTVVFEWAPGRAAWTPLPPMGTTRAFPTAAVLSDGRMLVAGGYDGDELDLASVEMLAADGSSWAALPPMAAARSRAVAGRLPGGQVIVAGGAAGDDASFISLASAELWDPATGAWAALPPMAQPRNAAMGCMLPSGRFAVLGGIGEDANFGRQDAEAFDPVSRAWQPLPPMPDNLMDGAVMAVAGGLLVVGGVDHAGAMLFDEESGNWFTLPGQMPAGREQHALVMVPTP
jgi:hypothetical protein